MYILYDFRLAFRRNSKEAALTNRMLCDLIGSFTMPSCSFKLCLRVDVPSLLVVCITHSAIVYALLTSKYDWLECFPGEGQTNAMDVSKLIRFFFFSFFWKFTRHATVYSPVNIVWTNFVFSEALSSHVSHYISRRDGGRGWIQL